MLKVENLKKVFRTEEIDHGADGGILHHARRLPGHA